MALRFYKKSVWENTSLTIHFCLDELMALLQFLHDFSTQNIFLYWSLKNVLL